MLRSCREVIYLLLYVTQGYEKTRQFCNSILRKVKSQECVESTYRRQDKLRAFLD